MESGRRAPLPMSYLPLSSCSPLHCHHHYPSLCPLLCRYGELREYCPTIPTLCIANKIDVDYSVTQKAFAFPAKHGLPLHYVSAADGTNVVQVFHDAIKAAWQHKHSGEKDFVSEVLDLLAEGPSIARPLGVAGTIAAGAAGGSGAAGSATGGARVAAGSK